jgi:hypothetical protein
MGDKRRWNNTFYFYLRQGITEKQKEPTSEVKVAETEANAL